MVNVFFTSLCDVSIQTVHFHTFSTRYLLVLLLMTAADNKLLLLRWL